MYLDVDRVDDWIDDISPQSEFLRADFVKYLKKEMSPEKMQISYGIDDMKIREQEWVTLVGLMLWNTSKSAPNWFLISGKQVPLILLAQKRCEIVYEEHGQKCTKTFISIIGTFR